MTIPIKSYIQQIDANLRAGNATEHTHRPALKSLLEAIDPTVIATNEPKRIACGAPDFVVARDGLIVGYVEAKDIGKTLSEVERSEQLKRYRRALGNLLLTDQLEFRWYVDGELRQTVEVGRYENGVLKSVRSGPEALAALLDKFLNQRTEDISTPRELAERMARLTHMIRDTIIEAFETDNASSLLLGWREAFARVLIADLMAPEKTAEFADMFAQTLAYGLFTARVMDPTPKTFSRHEAQTLIPKSNPFLRDFFYEISGLRMDDEPYAPFVDDLVSLLAHTDMGLVLAEFGKRTRQEDPIVHFYETFLAAYDPRLRESRGVYYTPEPVVSYIVRSVDYLLKTRFNLPGGLADTSMVTVPSDDPDKPALETHKVLILDPATGTGTFLYSVIDHIRQQFMDRNDAGLWPGYVREHLLPRLFGFELLMAPYAVAHFKLAMQLAGQDLPEEIRDRWAYVPQGDERLGVYLTNTLEAPHEMTGLPLFTQWVANESNAANAVKTELPVLVVMGNPPYSYESTNNGEWISNIIRDYYRVDDKPLGERNPKGLQDDYVKFIRFGQWRVDHSGSGILAFITNHGYLANTTFRGMRQSLLNSFSDLYILDLHGSTKKGELAEDGSKDDNVFDITAGVAIALFVKAPQSGTNQKCEVWHADLYGPRKSKYDWLSHSDIKSSAWRQIIPKGPYYLFKPIEIAAEQEYLLGMKLTDIFPVSSVGISTSRDKIAIQFTPEEMQHIVTEISRLPAEDVRQKYGLGSDSRDWKVALAQADLVESKCSPSNIEPILYRVFDERFTYYTGRSRGFQSMPRPEVSQLMLDGNNLMLVSNRQVNNDFRHVFASRIIVDGNSVSLASRERSYGFPLYITTETDENQGQPKLLNLFTNSTDEFGRTPNLAPTFIADLEAKLGLTFNPIQRHTVETEFGPEDVFHYIYAILHSPTYRERYAEFLKIDFPRIPLTTSAELFRELAMLGRELVALHLLESPAVTMPITSYPVPGDNRVEKGYPKFTQAHDEPAGRVHINKTQHFDGVPPEVWEFCVGGYQVCDKWLKDRRGRVLSYDDLTHYQQVVVALQRTIGLMDDIDAAIPEWPIV